MKLTFMAKHFAKKALFILVLCITKAIVKNEISSIFQYYQLEEC